MSLIRISGEIETGTRIRVSGVIETVSAGGNVNEPIANGTLRLTGFAPGTNIPATGVDEPVPSATLTLLGYAPATFIPFINRSVSNGSLKLTGYAPSIFIPHNVAIAVPNNVIHLTSYAPTARPPTKKKARVPAAIAAQRNIRRIYYQGTLYEIEEKEVPYFFYEALSRYKNELSNLEAGENTAKTKMRIRVVKSEMTKLEKKLSDVMEVQIEDEDELLMMIL